MKSEIKFATEKVKYRRKKEIEITETMKDKVKVKPLLEFGNGKLAVKMKICSR